MKIEYINEENYEAVLSFLKKENESISEWIPLLKDALFKICVINSQEEIECIFMFEDYPHSLLQLQYEVITKSNFENWLKNYYEIPYETYHTLWLTKWCISRCISIELQVDRLRFVFSSIFLSNIEIEAILLSMNVNETEKKFETLFNEMHRIHRNQSNETNDCCLSEEIKLLCCSSTKILPNIEIRKATVEDFDDLMLVFEENSSYLQQKHGEFFLAELIESTQKDKRLQTLVAIDNDKAVGFVCFTTNVDIISLRNSFYLESFDDFQATEIVQQSTEHCIDLELKCAINDFNRKAQNNEDFARCLVENIKKCYTEKEWMNEEETLLKQSKETENHEHYVSFIKLSFDLLDIQKASELKQYLNAVQEEKAPTLMIDNDESYNHQNINDNDMIIVINLLCIHSNYTHTTKIFAQTIFNYYPKCQYLLATIVHDQPTPNYLKYFSRVYPKACVECPYNLYLADKHSIHATISVRRINWKLDIEAVKKMINISVPNRESYLEKVYDAFVAIVDYKIVAVIYISELTGKQIVEFNTFYDVSSVIKDAKELNESKAAIVEFMSVNPIFAVYTKGMLKEVMRKLQIHHLFYRYVSSYAYDNNRDIKPSPDVQSAVIENFIQLKPKQFVYSSSSSKKHDTYALYVFCRSFYAQSQEIINHRIVIIGHSDDCCYGLIQYFMTQTDLKFANITFIDTSSCALSKNKFTQNLNDVKANTLLFKSNMMIDEKNGDYLQKLCIENKIEIVNDRISELDVNRKCIHLKNSGICMYDILIFGNGLSAVPLIPSHKYSLDTLLKRQLEFKNVLLISPEIEQNVANLQKYLENIDNLNAQQNIVFYGESINVYCIINHFITKYKINANQMIIVECKSSKSSQFYFRNDRLRTMIEKQLRNLGVRILNNLQPVSYIANKSNRYLIDGIELIQQDPNEAINAMIINENEDNEEESTNVVKLKLNSNTECEDACYSLSAQLVILCQNEIDFNILKITNQDPFVIDGQIVIDNEFRTQDGTIYAVGNIAKFSRKFSRNSEDALSVLQYANSFDIGLQCANKIVDHILNVNQNDNKEFSSNFEKEVCVVTQLNEGYTYFYAYNPRFAMRQSDNNNMQYFESCNENEISVIVLDSFGYLREILYYGLDWSPQWIQCANLINTHCSFLSNVQNYFDTKEEKKFVNICKIFNEAQYQIMCDDRFKNWAQKIHKSGTMDNDQLKNDIEGLIKHIVSTNET